MALGAPVKIYDQHWDDSPASFTTAAFSVAGSTDNAVVLYLTSNNNTLNPSGLVAGDVSLDGHGTADLKIRNFNEPFGNETCGFVWLNVAGGSYTITISEDHQIHGIVVVEQPGPVDQTTPVDAELQEMHLDGGDGNLDGLASAVGDRAHAFASLESTNANTADQTEIHNELAARYNEVRLIVSHAPGAAGTVDMTYNSDAGVNAPNWDIGAANFQEGAASSVTGNGAVTFGALGIAGAGTVPRNGDGAITFGTLGIAGAGTVPRTGDGAITLGGLTVAGTGAVATTGVGAVTFGALTIGSTGTVPRTGDGAVTFGALGVAGAGTVPRNGDGAITFGALSVAGTGTVPRAGDGALAFGGLLVAGTGTGAVVTTGNGAVTFGGLTIGAAGSVPRTGDGTVSLGALAVAGTGSVPRTGNGAVSLGALAVAGTGTVPRTGDGAIAFGGLLVAGTGEGAAVTVGNGTVSLGALAVAGTGSVPRTGDGAITLGALSVAGTETPPAVVPRSTLNVALGLTM